MINILFCGNYKVSNGILLAIMSIIKNTNETINFYILTADVSELNENYKPISNTFVEFITKYVKSKNPNNTVTFIKLDASFNEWVKQSQNKFSKYTPFCFLRLFTDKIKDLPEKLIYLDTDVLVPGNIEELYDIDVSNHEFAAVHDYNGVFFIGTNYFNSGVLLLNLKEIKKSKLFDKVKEMCINKKMLFPDQDALNKLATKVLYLPRKFNEQHKLQQNTVIQHFCKRIKWFPFFKTQNYKPWQIDCIHKYYKIYHYDQIFDEYLKLNINFNNVN